MTDDLTPQNPTSPEPQHAGALLRAARMQQGMHIGALSAAIKVPQAKLEALEAGRYDELLDAGFTRALANTICRVLKIDAAPVLAQLPGAGETGLASVDTGLNTPFRDRPGRVDMVDWAPWRHPVLWLVGLLLLSAAVPASAAATAAEAATTSASAAAAPAAATAAASGDALELRALQASWVQVVDGDNQTLMARMIPAGETVTLTAKTPLRLRIGNVQGTELRFRGQPVDLAPATLNNIANLSLP
jgi:cytoskeleton protein RodZ